MGGGIAQGKAENEAGGMASYKQQRFLNAALHLFPWVHS
jgi:hypothetical protein